jgi:hypothetical protein
MATFDTIKLETEDVYITVNALSSSKHVGEVKDTERSIANEETRAKALKQCMQTLSALVYMHCSRLVLKLNTTALTEISHTSVSCGHVTRQTQSTGCYLTPSHPSNACANSRRTVFLGLPTCCPRANLCSRSTRPARKFPGSKK